MILGFIGLGKMGSRMVGKLVTGKHTVHVWNRSTEPVEELKKTIPALRAYATVGDLVSALQTPRVVWMMLPAGEVTESMIAQLMALLAPNDILVDGGNAYFKDTEKRASNLADKQIRYLGIGVSGGIVAEKEGYPLMVGGNKSAYEQIYPILDTLASPHGGHAYFGHGGAGHFVKMVHNAIEYGYMQSLGEGFEILFGAPYTFDLRHVARLWQKGSLLSGFMLDRVVDALQDDPRLSNVVGLVQESGEARWAVEQAKDTGITAEIIERSLAYRRRSQEDKRVQETYTAKLIAALRAAFGGHPVVQKENSSHNKS